MVFHGHCPKCGSFATERQDGNACRNKMPRTTTEISRKNYVRLLKTLRQLQDIFTRKANCAYVKCSECPFGPALCDALNNVPETRPYMKGFENLQYVVE